VRLRVVEESIGVTPVNSKTACRRSSRDARRSDRGRAPGRR
jgi:hypothetical protein